LREAEALRAELAQIEASDPDSGPVVEAARVAAEAEAQRIRQAAYDEAAAIKSQADEALERAAETAERMRAEALELRRHAAESSHPGTAEPRHLQPVRDVDAGGSGLAAERQPADDSYEAPTVLAGEPVDEYPAALGDDVPRRSETTRYARQSAQLPRIGEEQAGSVLASMAGFRKKGRVVENDDEDD
jgi:hypothetical protein